MSEHLNAAKAVAEALTSDGPASDYSTEYVLSGILHALVAIAESAERDKAER